MEERKVSLSCYTCGQPILEGDEEWQVQEEAWKLAKESYTDNRKLMLAIYFEHLARYFDRQ